MLDINNLLIYLSSLFIALACLIALFTLAQSNSILAKLVSFEVLSNLMLASIACWAWFTKQAVFIDIAVTLALIMFLGNVAYYQYLAKKGHQNVRDHL